MEDFFHVARFEQFLGVCLKTYRNQKPRKFRGKNDVDEGSESERFID